MRHCLTFLQVRRHELLASTFAVLSMIWLLQMILAQGGKPTLPVVPVVDSKPPVLGVSTEEPDAPNALVRAAETSQRTEAERQHADSDESDAASRHRITNATDAETDAGDESVADESARRAELAAAEAEVPNRPQADPTTKRYEAEPRISTQAVTARADLDEPLPQPNVVEEAPKPVEQMSPEEIEKAVGAYMAWVRKGEVTLKLVPRLSADQLNSISSRFAITTAADKFDVTPPWTLLVDASGRFELLEAGTGLKGRWIGDLPLDRSKWPPQVVDKTRRAFGQFYSVGIANFFLADEWALRLFRLLAQDVGDEQPTPGTVFTVLLSTTPDNTIQASLIK